jgi:hypothetical protein
VVFTIGIVGGIGGLLKVKMAWPLRRVLMFAAANVLGLFLVFVIFATIMASGMRAVDDPRVSVLVGIFYDLHLPAAAVFPGLAYGGAFCLLLYKYLQRQKMFFFCAATAVLGVLAVFAIIPVVGPYLSLGLWQAGFAAALSRAIIFNGEVASS